MHLFLIFESKNEEPHYWLRYKLHKKLITFEYWKILQINLSQKNLKTSVQKKEKTRSYLFFLLL